MRRAIESANGCPNASPGAPSNWVWPFSNTKLMGLRLPVLALAGRSRHRFRLPAVWLREGQYTVHAAIARDGGIELNRLPNAAPLTVHARGRAVGFVSVDAELLDQ